MNCHISACPIYILHIFLYYIWVFVIKSDDFEKSSKCKKNFISYFFLVVYRMEATRWLTNKLGEESWVPVQIGTMLRSDNMRSVVDSYDALSSGTILKII